MWSRLALDWSDIFVFIGVACLAGAVWFALGWVGAFAFIGSVMLVLGLALARREGNDKPKG